MPIYLEYVLIALLGLAPSIVWLAFFENEEADHLESAGDLLYAFLLGVAATFGALLIQLFFARVVLPADFVPHSIFGIGLFAGIEELLKFLVVFWFIRKRAAFREPLDAMIFMITVALGFAAVENTATLFNQGGIATVFGSFKAFEIVALRFLGATLLHCVASGILGFHWAVGWVRQKVVWLHILAGLCIATLLHGVFNYLILMTGPASWAIVFVTGIAFFVIIDFEELRTEEADERGRGEAPPRLTM